MCTGDIHNATFASHHESWELPAKAAWGWILALNLIISPFLSVKKTVLDLFGVGFESPLARLEKKKKRRKKRRRKKQKMKKKKMKKKIKKTKREQKGGGVVVARAWRRR